MLSDSRLELLVLELANLVQLLRLILEKPIATLRGSIKIYHIVIYFIINLNEIH